LNTLFSAMLSISSVYLIVRHFPARLELAHGTGADSARN